MTGKNDKDLKMRKKLEKEWVAYFIDMVAGTHLMMLAMRMPERAEKLQAVLVLFLNDHYKHFLKKDKHDAEEFVMESSNGLIEILNSFMSKSLASTLIEGMPKRPNIIKPGAKQVPPFKIH